MALHRITTEYDRQFSRLDDAIRDRENEARKADLEERIAQGVQRHAGAAAFAEMYDAALIDAGAVDTAQRGTDLVNAAIAATVEQAGRKVVAASWSQEERQAKAFVDELESRGVTLGDTHFHGAEDDDDVTDEDTARLVAELEQSGNDLEIGPDAEGNMIYRDAETGEDYILT